MTSDKSLNTISGLGTEKLHLEEDKLNCLIVKLQRPKVLIFCPDYFFSALSRLYLFFLNNLTSQLPQGWHVAGSRLVCAWAGEPKETCWHGWLGWQLGNGPLRVYIWIKHLSFPLLQKHQLSLSNPWVFPIFRQKKISTNWLECFFTRLWSLIIFSSFLPSLSQKNQTKTKQKKPILPFLEPTTNIY